MLKIKHVWQKLRKYIHKKSGCSWREISVRTNTLDKSIEQEFRCSECEKMKTRRSVYEFSTDEEFEGLCGFLSSLSAFVRSGGKIKVKWK